jgi:O-antigen/teichoic acid export membrane protein
VIWIGGDRARRWARTLGEFALSQGFGQAAGMLAGLVYVRWMPVEQYALYALCLVALSVIAVGSDLGLTGSLAYFWRKSQQDGRPVAAKIELVRRLRSYLYLTALLIGVTLVATSARSLASSTEAIAAGIVLVAATAWVQTRSGIEILLVRLEGRQRASYYFEAAGSAVRLAAAMAMVATGVATAWFGLAGGLGGALATLWLLRRYGAESARLDADPQAADWREMRAYALPLLPSVLVYMIQDPIVMWLAAVRGGPVPVAEVHALGRIAAILSLVGTFVVVVLTPRLASINDDSHFIKSTLIGLLPLVALLLALIAGSAALPQIPLLLIGEAYAHLEREVAISVAIASSNVLIAYVALANRIKGWVRLEPLVAAFQALTILLSTILWTNFSTLGVLMLSLTLASTSLASFCVCSLVGMTKPEWARN